MEYTEVKVVIMAAGEGTRMKSSLPKVLHRAAGKTLVEWVADAAHAVTEKPILVYGNGGDAILQKFGDAFEYGDCIYIVSLDENNRPYMRVFENQVQYDVEMEPEYVEIHPEEIEEMQFEFAKIIGSIEDNEEIKELYNREIDIHEQQEDEYDYDFSDNFDE